MSQSADIVIVGAGPAGLSAALAAAPSGASIVILDDNPLPGGQIWRDGPNAHPPRPAIELRERVGACANIRIHNGTRVVALAGDRGLLLEDAEQGWRLDYQKLVLCTGARELLLPFPGWTLPGVTGAGGLQALVKGGLPVDGQRVVIAGSGPLLLASAATARANGARILRIAEQASWPALARFATKLPRWPNKLAQSLGLYDPSYRAGSHVVAALGSEHLEGVRLNQGGKLVEIECDRLACGFGLVPNTQLGQALGCSVDDGAIRIDAWQASSRAGIYAAGECTGFGGSELALVEGRIAGHAAVGDHHRARELWPQRKRWQGFADALARDFTLDPRLNHLAQPDTLVCRCEDVPYSALADKPDWTAAKLASRCGMGACQGRVCGAAARQLFGWQAPTPRPPFSPTRVETLLQLAED